LEGGDRPRGLRDQRRRLGAEANGLRTRGLAAGSSPLPWAHSTLAARPAPVKGLVGLDSGAVSSRGARSSSDRPTPRPGIVARSVAPRRGGGGEGKPAGSTAGPPTARRSAAPRAGGTGVDAPSAGVRPRPRQPTPWRRTPHARVRPRSARVSAQQTNPDFFAAPVRGAKTTSRPPAGARVSGFAARPAARRCGGSSSGSDGGGSGPAARSGSERHAGAAGRELVDRYRHRPHAGIEFHRPQKEEGAGGFRDHSGPPAPFLRSLPEETRR
jgi:hypothetical protein